MGDDSTCGRKRKPTSDYSAFGEAGSSAAAAVVAGAWVKTEKRLKSQHELLVMNLNVAETGHLKVTAPDLARTLQANNLELVGDGENSRVVSKLF
jgi:hypothetical protein